MRVSSTGSDPNVQDVDASPTKRSDKAAAAAKTRGDKKTDSTHESASGAEPARAELSSRGKEMSRAKAAADAAPDVREEKIAELKKRIEAGRYHVDADKVASRMVDEHMSSGIG